MKRKVIQIGDFTKVVSLPRDWTKKNNIQKGDELEINEVDNDVIISSSSHKRKINRAKVDFKDVDEEVIWPILSVMHKQGYDMIKISFGDPDVLGTVQKNISKALMGFEIINQTTDTCIIKNISNTDKSELDDIIRKIFSVTISLSNTSLEFIKRNENGKLDNLLHLEETNNKLTNLCERILNKTFIDTNNRYLYNTVWLLECIADDYKYICDFMKRNPKSKINRELINTYGDVNKLVEMFSVLFYSFSMKKIGEYINKRKRMLKKLELLSCGNDAEKFIISYLVVILKRIGDSVGVLLTLKAQLNSFDIE